MTQSVVSDQGLNCLPIIQQFINTSTGRKIGLFKLEDKYGKEFRCPNIKVYMVKKSSAKRGIIRPWQVKLPKRIMYS